MCFSIAVSQDMCSPRQSEHYWGCPQFASIPSEPVRISSPRLQAESCVLHGSQMSTDAALRGSPQSHPISTHHFVFLHICKEVCTPRQSEHYWHWIEGGAGDSRWSTLLREHAKYSILIIIFICIYVIKNRALIDWLGRKTYICIYLFLQTYNRKTKYECTPMNFQ